MRAGVPARAREGAESGAVIDRTRTIEVRVTVG